MAQRWSSMVVSNYGGVHQTMDTKSFESESEHLASISIDIARNTHSLCSASCFQQLRNCPQEVISMQLATQLIEGPKSVHSCKTRLRLPVIPKSSAPNTSQGTDHLSTYRCRKQYDRFLVREEQFKKTIWDPYTPSHGDNAVWPCKQSYKHFKGMRPPTKHATAYDSLLKLRESCTCLKGKRKYFMRTPKREHCQKEGESINSFLEQFQAIIEAFEHYGGSIGNDKGLLDAINSENSNNLNRKYFIRIKI